MKTNLVGKRFGRLIAESVADSINNCTRWNCVCECGNTCTKFYSNLVNKSTVSCGKCPLDDLKGKTFYSLTVISKSLHKKNRSRWVCQCECGKTTIATGASLRSGHKKSCGCRHQLSLKPKNETTLCRSLWSTYKSLARKRGYIYELSFDEFAILTKMNCTYCGKEPSQVLNPRRRTQVPYVYNGVDRIDNTRGYVTGNVTSCCGMCNAFKSDYGEEQFLSHCKRITEFTNSKR